MQTLQEKQKAYFLCTHVAQQHSQVKKYRTVSTVAVSSKDRTAVITPPILGKQSWHRIPFREPNICCSMRQIRKQTDK